MRHNPLKPFLALVALLLVLPALQGQMFDPVNLSFSQEKRGNNTVRLSATATMDQGWHIYSVNTPDSSFIIGSDLVMLDTLPGQYRLAGSLQEPKPHTEYDPNFKETLSYHEGSVTIYQDIEVLTEEDFTLEVEFTYQTCNEGRCLPPEYVPHTFSVAGVEQPKEPQAEDESAPGEETAAGGAPEEADASGPGHPPSEDEVAGEELEIDYAQDEDSSEATAQEESPAAQTNQEERETQAAPESNRSLVGIFVLAFLGGFAALLTPCVFPMIPLTVSFFTKQSKNRAKGIANAVIYGLSIIVLYTLIGLLITVVFGSDALNAISTNPWLNLFFFLLLVVFAISFFGAFEITLPSSWVNKTDEASNRGGILGIFFMALTLAIVSFSCTGPIIGGLLVEAARGGVQGPLVGMFGFSLALALPFALFAAFPGWLNSLPKSGGWLNNVKVVLGFVELAFAFKFLSTADLVWQAGLLKREWFIAIWIGLGILLTLYLLGSYRMPHDSVSEKISVPRLLLAVVSLSFTIYLIPGMWGAPLKLISGFPPPQFYSENPGGISSSGGAVVSAGGQKKDSPPVPDGADPEHCPHGLNCFHDFAQARAYAKKVNKPLLLDFTGWGCVNCRKMEANVWSDPRVMEILKNEVVLTSLYVDERKKLPKEERFTSKVTGKKIRTIGNKWSNFQVKHYQSNSQPQYVIIGHQSMEPLNGTVAYDPNVRKYLNWLQAGIAEFEAQDQQVNRAP
ncbi:MAG: cytochrome c biogenesis protein CcdA [Schleiferiaceae bacterium]|nr:cytochrome c biogenesis protein CcdA [Schleiferiaceae bacterium]MDR9441302.1 cytochrome c biogenesis protein CcdA [Schleiferiaceae bacterium]